MTASTSPTAASPPAGEPSYRHRPMRRRITALRRAYLNFVWECDAQPETADYLRGQARQELFYLLDQSATIGRCLARLERELDELHGDPAGSDDA